MPRRYRQRVPLYGADQHNDRARSVSLFARASDHYLPAAEAQSDSGLSHRQRLAPSTAGACSRRRFHSDYWRAPNTCSPRRPKRKARRPRFRPLRSLTRLSILWSSDGESDFGDYCAIVQSDISVPFNLATRARRIFDDISGIKTPPLVSSASPVLLVELTRIEHATS